MKKNQFTLLFSLASVVLVLAGCGSGSYTPPSYGAGSSVPYFEIMTQTQSTGGSSELWGNVSVSGYGNNLEIACDVATDTTCIPQVYGPHNPSGLLTENAISAFTTDKYGNAIFHTNAEGASWAFFGDDKSDSTNTNYCSTSFATNTTMPNQQSGFPVVLQCGANAETLIASPSACGIIWVYNSKLQFYQEENTCPSSLALTVPSALASSNPLPTNMPLVQADVTNTGANVEQSSVSTSSTTTISVPVPSTQGTTYVVVANPQSNQLIGIAPFTYTVQQDPCPNKKRCN